MFLLGGPLLRRQQIVALIDDYRLLSAIHHRELKAFTRIRIQRAGETGPLWELHMTDADALRLLGYKLLTGEICRSFALLKLHFSFGLV